jgi:Outer membrane protein and related peptidoglycan-associated (lipo)proteins
MKKILSCLLFCFVVSFSNNVSSQGLLNKIKEKVKQRTDQKTDEAIDKGLDKTEDAAKGDTKTKEKIKVKTGDENNAVANTSVTTTAALTLQAYQNFDFVPGDKVLFDDNFLTDQDAEFPAHWELLAGQGQLNKVGGEEAFFLTEGNYVKVKPRMKTEKYLTDPFTIEFDYYHAPGAYQVLTMLQYLNPECDCEGTVNVGVGPDEVVYEGPVHFSKSYSENMGGEENFNNKWHHVSMAYKNHQLKVYVDQNRILTVPDTKAEFYNVQFGGIGDEKNPIIFKNVRIASGGNMNMLGKKFTESKIITHGINFDIDKATIKPESMGTLNMIVQVMKDNPEIKFEIDGHTDNSGTAAHNLTLSQQRADAVKTQLVNMGVDASRLTTKGFGDTKPISDNTTLEGKANNRRVEFVKL